MLRAWPASHEHFESRKVKPTSFCHSFFTEQKIISSSGVNTLVFTEGLAPEHPAEPW